MQKLPIELQQAVCQKLNINKNEHSRVLTETSYAARRELAKIIHSIPDIQLAPPKRIYPPLPPRPIATLQGAKSGAPITPLATAKRNLPPLLKLPAKPLPKLPARQPVVKPLNPNDPKNKPLPPGPGQHPQT